MVVLVTVMFVVAGGGGTIDGIGAGVIDMVMVVIVVVLVILSGPQRHTPVLPVVRRRGRRCHQSCGYKTKRSFIILKVHILMMLLILLLKIMSVLLNKQKVNLTKQATDEGK